MLTLNTSEDAIQPLAVEMYTITCLLHAQHAFQQDNLWHSCKNGSEPVETDLEDHNISCSSTISAVRAQYQYLRVRT